MPVYRGGHRDLKNSGSQNIVTILNNDNSTSTPLRGASNRNRHVNPYIQNKNRQGSVIKQSQTKNNSISRNQLSQEANNSIIHNIEEKGPIVTQSVSPIVSSPIGN